MGISQRVKVNKGIGELPNPTVISEHSFAQRIGQVAVWESGYIDFEIVDIDNGKQILWGHQDLEGKPDFEKILKEYFKLLIKTEETGDGSVS
jgi:hypothetical protein